MNREVNDYFALFASEGTPPFLKEYAAAPEMLRLRGVGLFCGTDYSRLYAHRYFYSRYEHSIAVALIVWRFTGDKAQALSGLFHDIATPVFSHSVDFMNGDALSQSSTEEPTRSVLENSPYIRRRLSRDGIALGDVVNYHLYPIADNDMPRLSADRLEYTLSTMLVWQGKWTLDDAAQIIGGLTVHKNEDGQMEIGFADLGAAMKFVDGACVNGKAFQRNDNKLSLNLLGDILRMALAQKVVTEKALYALTERQMIDRLKASRIPRIRDAWRNYEALCTVHGSDATPGVGYAVSVEAKRRYIDPLVMHGGQVLRTSAASGHAKAAIDSLLAYKDKTFAYVDFTV